MSYPQPDADQYAVKGYQLFRLNTLLASPGDIYQSKQSGHALALGPDSDIANVNVAYFDDQVPTFMQRTSISPARAFTGRMDARNDAAYSPSGRPGVIMLWSDDIYDPSYRPVNIPEPGGGSFIPAVDTIEFVTPRLDVIEYFQKPSSLGPGRRDKEYAFQTFQSPHGGAGRYAFLVIPFYGRKYASVSAASLTGTLIFMLGVNFLITQDEQVFPPPTHLETALIPFTTLTSTPLTTIITASQNGTYDALVLGYLPGATPTFNAPTRILVSDSEQ